MTTLLDEPLYLIGKIPNNDTIPGENANPNRFVRISNERVAMNDWDGLERTVKTHSFPMDPSILKESLSITRGVDCEKQPYILITVQGRLSHITMQCWDHRPTRLYTVMRNLLGRREMPFQIMEMNPASTARFQQFAIAVAEQTGRTEIKEALTTLWATSSMKPLKTSSSMS